MSASAPVIEVHTSAGKTLPFRPQESKTGNVYWGITRPTTRKFAGKFGINVTDEVTGSFDKLTSVRVATPDGKSHEFKLVRDTSEKGKPRVTAKGDLQVDGSDKVFTLRVTLMDAKQGIVNITGSINGKAGGGERKLQVFTEL